MDPKYHWEWFECKATTPQLHETPKKQDISVHHIFYNFLIGLGLELRYTEPKKYRGKRESYITDRKGPKRTKAFTIDYHLRSFWLKGRHVHSWLDRYTHKILKTCNVTGTQGWKNWENENIYKTVTEAQVNFLEDFLFPTKSCSNWWIANIWHLVNVSAEHLVVMSTKNKMLLFRLFISQSW